jgi:Restriction endonuclease
VLATAAEYENRIKLLDWNGLRSLWDSIESRDTATADWDAGKAFEYLVLRAFELDGAKVKFPYTVRLFNEEIEQIDGAIHYAGISCLVESKDFADDVKVNIAPIAKLRNQLLRRPSGIVGLVFSRTGFTNPARNLCCFSAQQGILLWNGEEIKYALDNETIGELLVLKYRMLVEDGLPDYNVLEVNFS